jgi:hypothetical protein
MSQVTGNIELYEKRFGLLAIERGYITSDDLIRAIKVQVEEDVANKSHRLIGEILLDMNCLTATQIQEILDNVFKK